METGSNLLRPHLRLLRRSPSPGSDVATPRPTHDDDDGLPTPRMLSKPISDLTTAETPAARLRALLAREPRSPTAAPPPAPPSEADSATDPRFGSSTSSVTRESLKDIFSRALREPGDTPRKGRLRRNSFDGSSMEITPVVDRDRGQRRAARRSLSDEEAEKPSTWPSHIPLACLATSRTRI
jgi:serine/arginine repetitive matrix protein 2